jgi:hypothetical protein
VPHNLKRGFEIMNALNKWAIKNHVSEVAMKELQELFIKETLSDLILDEITGSESGVSHVLRIKASEQGAILWRNNVGAGKLENGRFIRWGLCNDTKQINERIKSADLIGIRPVKITPDMVGKTIGQFLSREVKKRGWAYQGTNHEAAQIRWCELINSFGGDASISTGDL